MTWPLNDHALVITFIQLVLEYFGGQGDLEFSCRISIDQKCDSQTEWLTGMPKSREASAFKNLHNDFENDLQNDLHNELTNDLQTA